VSLAIFICSVASQVAEATTKAYEFLHRDEGPGDAAIGIGPILFAFLSRLLPTTTATTTTTTSTSANITVRSESCLDIANEFTKQFGNDKVCLLNLANQFHVGGDYLSGSGQEESIVKSSNLLDSLCTLKDGIKNGNASNPYQYNLHTTVRFSDDQHEDQWGGFGELTCLYSNGVTIRGIDGRATTESADANFCVNIISSAAYNLQDKGQNACVNSVLYELGTILKIINQLRVAKQNQQRHLVLGAFGCGAFQNNPGQISNFYHMVIHDHEFCDSFDSICFAVMANKHAAENPSYDAFNTRFMENNFAPGSLHQYLLGLRKDITAKNESGEYGHALAMVAGELVIRTADRLRFYAMQMIRKEIQAMQTNTDLTKRRLAFLQQLLQQLDTRTAPIDTADTTTLQTEAVPVVVVVILQHAVEEAGRLAITLFRRPCPYGMQGSLQGLLDCYYY
jgi:uncharacterized protein (TIGR02452 family)